MDVYWFEQTEADVPCSDRWLTSLEALRLSALAFPKRRADWRLGRWTAKNAVCEFLKNRSPDQIEIRACPSGAPEVWFANRRQALTISLSHRAGVACCAVTEHPAALGCDFEVNEPHSPAFVADYFTAAEQVCIAHRRAVADAPDTAALMWSAKESALKALGVGLREDTRCVAVQEDTFACLQSSSPIQSRDREEGYPYNWRRLHLRHHDRDLHGWWRADQQFVRTLVADPPPHAPRELPVGDGVSKRRKVYDIA